jgi:hypothetical protein
MTVPLADMRKRLYGEVLRDTRRLCRIRWRMHSWRRRAVQRGLPVS